MPLSPCSTRVEQGDPVHQDGLRRATTYGLAAPRLDHARVPVVQREGQARGAAATGRSRGRRRHRRDAVDAGEGAGATVRVVTA